MIQLILKWDRAELAVSWF